MNKWLTAIFLIAPCLVAHHIGGAEYITSRRRPLTILNKKPPVPKRRPRSTLRRKAPKHINGLPTFGSPSPADFGRKKSQNKKNISTPVSALLGSYRNIAQNTGYPMLYWRASVKQLRRAYRNRLDAKTFSSLVGEQTHLFLETIPNNPPRFSREDLLT